MTEYDNKNRIAIFKNDDRREGKNDPEYRGTLNVDGKEFYVDLWVSEAKKTGRKFFSGKVKPKLASQHSGGSGNPPAAKADFDDAIPF